LLAAAVVAVATLFVTRAVAQSCMGDCNDDGRVTVDELVLGVDLAINGDPTNECPSITCLVGHGAAIPCLVIAVQNALYGCDLCGTVVCQVGEYCCNPVLGICARVGDYCVQ